MDYTEIGVRQYKPGKYVVVFVPRIVDVLIVTAKVLTIIVVILSEDVILTV